MAAAPAPAATPTTEAMADNVAGLLAYITVIPAIIFLVMEPYNKRPFVRFHSFQCIFFSIAWMAVWFVLMFLGAIPYVGYVMFFLFPLLGLAGTVLWVFLLLKAYQGQVFKLPVIGDLAERQSKVS
ncbi:MAG TPA: DUF4870 domain-containing protein [Clostridia bacterium]|nr:DUF4870 domain-containing protein [Clostridia bacterium]